MPAYQRGDRVVAKREIVRPDITIAAGSKGKVMVDSPRAVVTARVKFNMDHNKPFRVVPKSKLMKA